MGKFILPVLCAALLSACAGAPVREGGSPAAAPDWTGGDSAQYPRARFLTGVGCGDGLSSAQDRARGEISRVFSTQVTMKTYVTASERTASQDGRASASSSQDVTQAVRSDSSKMLEGVEIVRSWQDPATGRHYALAALERSKARAALDGKLDELDARVTDLNGSFAAASDKMSKAKFALKLLALFKDRESLTTDLRVLDPGGSFGPAFDINGLRRAAAGALAALDVEVRMSGEESAKAAAEIIKTLNTLGIQAKTGGGNADITVDCPAKFETQADPDPRSRWKWYRGSAAVSLKDVKAAKLFLSFDVSAKEAAASPGEARQKTEVSLGKKAGAGIARGITSYFENQ
ncbi:MAG: hypothetical protein COT18_10775 [Elusimicrobia bacterium CG08_land_8_20_14_0_20_59_10]|nr:MAG: hypothetical protein COT18_10775 [Elusimicrobia bacterium CG08_land_8_20_14_0_20_59_10]